MGMVQEFKEFAVKGNVIDLAVAVIIGGAFGAIVKSFVNDLILPLIGAVFAVPDFSTFSFTLNGSQIMVGLFIQTVVNFLIVSFSIFFMVKLLATLKKKEDPVDVPTPLPSSEVILLQEIRDLLRDKQ